MELVLFLSPHLRGECGGHLSHMGLHRYGCCRLSDGSNWMPYILMQHIPCCLSFAVNNRKRSCYKRGKIYHITQYLAQARIRGSCSTPRCRCALGAGGGLHRRPRSGEARLWNRPQPASASEGEVPHRLRARSLVYCIISAFSDRPHQNCIKAIEQSLGCVSNE